MSALETKEATEITKTNEPIKESGGIGLEFDGEQTSFVSPSRGERWRFKKMKDNSGIEFFIDKSLGKVTVIDISRDDGSVTVEALKEKYATEVKKDLIHYPGLVRQLRRLCEQHKKILRERPVRMIFGALMLAAMNGRCNFDFYLPSTPRECPKSCEPITRERLLKMLQRENEMRLSKELLEALESESCKYENATCNNYNERQVYLPQCIVNYQENLVKEFGYKSDIEMNYALDLLRSARALFPNDIEIKNAAFYLKYNRSSRGELRVDDRMKDVPLMTCGEEEKWLSEIINKEKATIIISGSVT